MGGNGGGNARIPVSVLVLTLNEERNLRACLDAVSWSDDIVVFDSHSSDGTVGIAREYGARVIQRRFDNERDHRTAAIRCEFKHPWVFNPDADEIAPVSLAKEIADAVADHCRPAVAYRIRRRDIFMDTWIRHSSLYPTWLVRLFRPGFIEYRRSINLDTIVRGPEDRLESDLMHYSFNNGLEAWFAKHNRYSSCEALETIRTAASWDDLRTAVTASDPVIRRRSLKRLSMCVPFRPLFRFLYMYIVRCGCLDGRAGFHYCRLLSLYEYMIVLKSQELRSGFQTRM